MINSTRKRYGMESNQTKIICQSQHYLSIEAEAICT